MRRAAVYGAAFLVRTIFDWDQLSADLDFVIYLKFVFYIIINCKNNRHIYEKPAKLEILDAFLLAKSRKFIDKTKKSHILRLKFIFLVCP